MDDDRAGGNGPGAGPVEIQLAGIGGYPMRVQQATPSRDLVFVMRPSRAVVRLWHDRVPITDQPIGCDVDQTARRLRTPAVEIDRDVGCRFAPREWGEGLCRRQPVDLCQARERRLPCRSRKHQLVLGVGMPQRSQRGYRGAEVAESECSEGENPRTCAFDSGQGHDGSLGAAITNSLTSTPIGLASTHTTAAAISAGSARRASGPGRY
jgi:hypothetical protein